MGNPLDPHLAKTHEQFPDGFPPRVNDILLGHWKTPTGVVVVEHHPHGYEVHFNPCYDFGNCEACAPDLGPSNPHTPHDGHHFRLCERRGPVVTVAGGEVGYRAVLQYLAEDGSEPHVKEFREMVERDVEKERQFRVEEAKETKLAMEEQEQFAPNLDERLNALQAEFDDLKKRLQNA